HSNDSSLLPRALRPRVPPEPAAGGINTTSGGNSGAPRRLLALVRQLLDVGEHGRIEAAQRLRAPPERAIEEVKREIALDVPDVSPGKELRLARRRPSPQDLRDLAVVGEARMRGAEEARITDDALAGRQSVEHLLEARRDDRAERGTEEERRN